jgi:uncharacterized UPF0160 family protein
MPGSWPIVERSFGTHDGTFHADEVTACALLQVCNLIDKEKISRSREESLLNTCEYVCDVGGIYDPAIKRFDHHQKEYSGILSSAGMILDYLRAGRFLNTRECDLLNNCLVRGVDAHDNGKDPLLQGYCLFSHIISNFAPIEYDATKEDLDAAFTLAVDFTYGHIVRLLNRFRYNQSSKAEVHAAMATPKGYLLFHRHIPWIDVFFELGGEHHKAKFVIMPTGEHWKLRGIPPTSDDRMRVRLPMPSSWAGLMNEELQKASGINGAIFCHKGRFISVFETEEAAIRAAEYILNLPANYR